MRRAVDDRLERMAGDHVRVVDEDRPEVDKEEQAEIEPAVEGEDENEKVVWHGLEVAIEWVEGVRGVGGRDYENGISSAIIANYNRQGVENSLSHLWWGL